MVVFDGVRYSLSPSLSPTRRTELASVLDLNGAAPHPPYTHLIVLPSSHAHNDATNDPALKLVTDRWVDRSVVLGKCQPEQYYSPDPAMIFSGVVACATDLSTPDLEVLSAGITALGGQWRIGLTRDVTHLFALRPGSDKYNTALHFAKQTQMQIVTPHWFDDAVRLGRRIPESPYTWPDPLVLRPGANIHSDENALTVDGKRKRGTAETETGDVNSTNEVDHVRVWEGRRILLSPSLELGVSSRPAIEAGIRRAGGVVVDISANADEDAEEKAIDECDVLVTRWRCGRAYFKAAHVSLLIGTLSWLFSVESSGTLHSPLDSLLWYPTPRGGIPGLIDCEISVTNYTGAARDYLKRLIGLVGAKFTPSMSQSNKVLVAGFQPSPKTARALSWSIPVVNHTWLEDCFIEWRSLTIGLERYIVYPPGVDFGKMLMMRQDESVPSQSGSALRLSGGAVPGGRGVGVINLELEEKRDAEYRVRADNHKSMLEGGESTDLDVRPRSRANSVKKTPSSSAKVKRASTLTPLTASATGVFSDHVIEIPSDAEDVGGKRPSANGKQRVTTPLHGSRGTPRSVRRAPSADLFSTGTDVGVVVHRSGGSSKEKARANERIQGPVQTSKPDRPAKGVVGSDLHLGEESEESVPPRRRVPSGSRTPIKSGMKPRPRSLSRSVRGAESENEVQVIAVASETVNRPVKPVRKSKVVAKDKGKEKANKVTDETEKGTSRPTRSPSSDDENARKPKRRLSVLVPPVPKDYFSSQSGQNASEAEGEGKSAKRGTDAGATLGPKRKPLAPGASTGGHDRPLPPKSLTNAHARRSEPKPKSGASKKHVNGDEEHSSDGGNDDRSMVIDIPVSVSSTGRKGPRRSAADKATIRLRDDVMPDVLSYEKERKLAKRRRSEDWESVASARGRGVEERDERVVKKRKGREEEAEEAEVEDLVPSVRGRPKSMSGKSKAKGKTVMDPDQDTDEPPTKNKPSGSEEKKGRARAKELGATRLMTTGVSLSDEVVKRLLKLGVQMTTKPTDCTHLVAKGIVRTEKFLCAMSVSPFILTEEWAIASAKTGKLLPEKDYLLSDSAAEEKWTFKFADALIRAKGPDGGPNLFKQMTFYVTPKAGVDVKLLRNVIMAGGGHVQTVTPTARILNGKANRFVVSSEADKAIWRPLAAEGFKVYSTELVLRGALRQEIEWEKKECLIAG